MQNLIFFLIFLPIFILLTFPTRYYRLLNTLGYLVCFMGLAMVIPALLDTLHPDDQWDANGYGFGLSALVTLFNGIMMTLSTRNRGEEAHRTKDVFLFTGLTWVTLSLCATIPFLLTFTTYSTTDAFFEAISAITTTGATVLTGIDFASPGIVLWRSMLQWFGGIGIVVMAMVILPDLRIGGMQLFRSEFSDRSDKVLPRVRNIAKNLFLVYIGLTLACTFCLLVAEMSVLDAICHGLTIMATGGFSTMDSSIGAFHNLWVEGIAVFFMILSGTSLILYLHLYKGSPRKFYTDDQFRAYLKLLGGASLLLTLWLVYHEGYEPFIALRHGIFTAVSIITTSGFSNCDFGNWTGFPLVLIFFLMILGGCSGSTSSGLKIFRIQVMFRVAKSQMRTLTQPHGIFLPQLEGRNIDSAIVAAILTFVGVFLLTGVGFALTLSLFDLDFITALSGAFSALSNVGPGLGDIIGPSGNYQPLPIGSKWVLMAAMFLGRLELLTLLVFLSPSFWER